MEIDHAFPFKLILIGDSSVGKSNIFMRYLNSTFEKEYNETLEPQFGSKNIVINDDKIKLQIWDIAGKEEYKVIISTFLKGALGAIIVYDITQKNSFNNIENLIKYVKENADNNIALILLGNKSDLNSKREVLEEEGLNLSKKYNINFYETSSLNGENINKAINDLANSIYQINFNCLNIINEENNDKSFIDVPPATPLLSKESLKEFCYTCTECPSTIEIISINESENSIKFKCLNVESHGKKLHLKDYFQKINNYKETLLDGLKVECQKHLSSKNNIFVGYCLDCNCQLCQNCLKTRIHFNHKKNSILEIEPKQEELNIIDKVIQIYKKQLKKLESKQENNNKKLEDAKNLKNKLEQINKIKEEVELEIKKQKFLHDMKNIQKIFEKILKYRKNQFINDCIKIKNKYRSINNKEFIHFNLKKEKLIEKYNNDIKRFDERIQNLNNIIKINESIYYFYIYKKNYYNAININNLVLNYLENNNIKEKIIKKYFPKFSKEIEESAKIKMNQKIKDNMEQNEEIKNKENENQNEEKYKINITQLQFTLSKIIFNNS